MAKRREERERTDLVRWVAEGRGTVAAAARRHEVSMSTAFRWMREAREAGEGAEGAAAKAGAPRFARLVMEGAVGSEIVVRVGVAEIAVTRGFDGELLRAVVAALGGEA